MKIKHLLLLTSILSASQAMGADTLTGTPHTGLSLSRIAQTLFVACLYPWSGANQVSATPSKTYESVSSALGGNTTKEQKNITATEICGRCITGYTRDKYQRIQKGDLSCGFLPIQNVGQMFGPPQPQETGMSPYATTHLMHHERIPGENIVVQNTCHFNGTTSKDVMSIIQQGTDETHVLTLHFDSTGALDSLETNGTVVDYTEELDEAFVKFIVNDTRTGNLCVGSRDIAASTQRLMSAEEATASIAGLVAVLSNVSPINNLGITLPGGEEPTQNLPELFDTYFGSTSKAIHLRISADGKTIVAVKYGNDGEVTSNRIFQKTDDGSTRMVETNSDKKLLASTQTTQEFEALKAAIGGREVTLIENAQQGKKTLPLKVVYAHEAPPLALGDITALGEVTTPSSSSSWGWRNIFNLDWMSRVATPTSLSLSSFSGIDDANGHCQIRIAGGAGEEERYHSLPISCAQAFNNGDALGLRG